MCARALECYMQCRLNWFSAEFVTIAEVNAPLGRTTFLINPGINKTLASPFRKYVLARINDQS